MLFRDSVANLLQVESASWWYLRHWGTGLNQQAASQVNFSPFSWKIITVKVSVAIAIDCTIHKHFQNCCNSSIISKLNTCSELQSSDHLVFLQETATFPETPHFYMIFTSLGFTSEHSMAKEYSGPRTNKVWYSSVHSILNSPDDFLWITLANWHSSSQSKRSFLSHDC